MSTTILNPYLFFVGNCAEAMEFYKSIFGGELEISRFGDGPADAHADAKANSEEVKDQVMHARLDGPFIILASDNPHNPTQPVPGQFSLSIEGTESNTLTDYFNKLSEGGTVVSPLQKQFWGDTFGMVTDKFGIGWMVSIK